MILTSKSSGTEPATQANAAPAQPGQPPVSAPAEGFVDMSEDANPDQQQEGVDIFANADDQNNAQPAEQQQQNAFGASPFGQQPGAVKTPEQMLQELQQRQQQIQQQQGGVQPGSPNGFPNPGTSPPVPSPH